MDNPTEIQIASDQTADSDVEFLSAESSRVEDGETPYQDSLAVTEGSTTANGDVNLNQSKKEDTGSNGVESNEPGFISFYTAIYMVLTKCLLL